ncbi:ATP-binding protein [Vibrio parahaemolyticus]|uniref:ATP-binding protein n=1 Tax=Vibrio parahaemolyticus TaxID=670 RepID=UPI0015BE29C7|nr:ATP-binding protein [Vibrio parahaemolyticus]QLE24608.1 AAA family ATPase [Vibrio parahaemolyticus]HCE1878487.1 AAA family ATPase [Vibrio parahaemolyticus]HCE3643695.1 AAA family ATPase [Vibrio parahaemolyticus]HCE4533553.1 AAA family ATPase [Vibrio parahaemolyticus]
MLVEISDLEMSRYAPPFGRDSLLNQCRKVADVIFSDNNLSESLLKEIELTGTFLYYGKTGTGKTTTAFEIIRYVESKYGVTPYRVDVSSIITSRLGDTVKNFESVFTDIRENSNNNGALILLDEFDRFVVNRDSDVEISELKRSLLSMMDFFSSIQWSDKLFLIAITNHIESIDPALRRRFSFIEEISSTQDEVKDYYKSKKDFFESHCLTLPEEVVSDCLTIAELKQEIRKVYLESI